MLAAAACCTLCCVASFPLGRPCDVPPAHEPEWVKHLPSTPAQACACIVPKPRGAPRQLSHKLMHPWAHSLPAGSAT